MRRLHPTLLLAFVLAACDTPDPGSGGGGSSATLTFAASTPPLNTGFGNARPLVTGPPALFAAYGQTLLTPGYVSRDRGLTWLALTTALVDPVVFESASSVLAMTSSGLGRYDLAARSVALLPKPSDGTSVNLGAYRARDKAVFSRGGTDRVYRFAEGAWTYSTYPRGTAIGVYDLAVDETRSLYVLLGDRTLSVSEDDGATWTLRTYPYTTGGVVDLAVSPITGALFVYEPGGRTLLRSTDHARTWQTLAPPVSSSGSIGTVRVTRTGELWVRNWRSTDDGATWATVLDYTALGAPLGARDVVVPDETGGLFAVLQDAGVFVAPTPASRLDYAGGFDAAQTAQTTDNAPVFGHTAVHFSDGSALTNGARYDPTTQRWRWSPVGGVMHRLPGGRVAAMGLNTVQFSSDQGRTWTAAVQIGSLSGEAMVPRNSYGIYALSDGRLVASAEWQNPRTFAQEQRLYTSRDNGQTWALTRRTPSTSSPLAMAVDGTTVYTVGFFSRDGGVATGEAWGNRVPLASLPSGGVLFYTLEAPLVLKRWKDGQETTLGTLPAPSNTNAYSWVADVDESGYVYTMCGSPLTQFCKSNRAFN